MKVDKILKMLNASVYDYNVVFTLFLYMFRNIHNSNTFPPVA